MWNVTFEPLLPIPVLIGAAVLAALLLVLAFWNRQRGAAVRSLAFAALLMALANPSFNEIDREDLPGVVAIVVDESASQSLGARDQIARAARTALGDALGRFKTLDIRWGNVTARDGSDGTELFSALGRTVSDVPPDRIAGAILVTDGQIHDVPARAAALGFRAPVHVLLTGKPGERDRRVVVHRAPRFGIVGQAQPLTFRVEDTYADNDGPSGPQRVQVTVRRDGEVLSLQSVTVGDNVTLPVEITHGGENIIELEAVPLEGELTEVNNRAVVSTQGIRENLRVLLVSGEPHAGERTWRNLLKSDAAVDLVHFTILRPPEKQDGTPINQLSLIAFPTRELFSVKIDEFDLIIFDRYQRRGVLPIIYFDNISRYVREGGALLVAAGPDFASNASIYRSPLAPVLPASPSGQVLEKPFRAEVTERGRRHPVTRDLPGSRQEPPAWGRWFRSVEAQPDRGETVMSGPDKSPLLVLSREEEGRVALLLSDQAWLWSRGFEGGGPQIALLRQLSHWLMKEPELEEERLTGKARGSNLLVERQTMQDKAPPVKITDPSGKDETLELKEAEPGLWRGELATTVPGLYRLDDGEHVTLVNVGPLNQREFLDVISTDKLVRPLVEETGGGIARAGTAERIALPRFTFLSDARRWAGDGWMGLKKTDSYLVRGIQTVPLFAGFLGLAALLLVMAATWFREGR